MVELAALSLVLLALSVVGIVWDIASGLLVTGIDGILLLLVCLMMGGVFTLELFLVGRQAGWVPAFGGKEGKKKDAPQPAARPVSANAAVPAAIPPATSAVAPPTAAKPPAVAKTAAAVPVMVPAGIPEPVAPAPASAATAAAIAEQPPAPVPADGRATTPIVAPAVTDQSKTEPSK
jgi:hypothetical protein